MIWPSATSKTSCSSIVPQYSCLKIVADLRKRWPQEGEGHRGVFLRKRNWSLSEVKAVS